jgi:hypothetical protein
MIESKKVKGKAKSVVLPNGREVTYCYFSFIDEVKQS